jgi:hypothetical protein
MAMLSMGKVEAPHLYAWIDSDIELADFYNATFRPMSTAYHLIMLPTRTPLTNWFYEQCFGVHQLQLQYL